MSGNGNSINVDESLRISIDGRKTLTAETVEAVTAACRRCEDHDGTGIVIVQVSGAPGRGWTDDLDVALVSKWERALRRLEQLAVVTVAIAAGDCGGTALDALLATDYRIAAPAARLLVPVADGATWPGMAMYRLAQQAGVARVRRALLFGSPINAAEALELGLIDQLAEEPTAALSTTPDLFGVEATPELAIRRRLMLDATTTSFEEALGSYLAACDRALRRSLTGATS